MSTSAPVRPAIRRDSARVEPTLVTRAAPSPRRRKSWAPFAAAALIATTVGIGLQADDPTVLAGDASTMELGIDAATLSPGSMYNVVDQIGARDLWAQGITGAGVNVAVIDTGVAPIDSLGNVVAVADLSSEAGDPSTAFIDTYGHGTAMAGIIAGSEPGADPATAADHPEKFLGVAPDAGIVSVKISGRDGSSDPADVVAGIDWVIANAERLDITVISLSYDSGSPLPYTADPLTAAVERAWNAGITVVAMAGNEGADADRLASPGIDPFVITVAGAEATDDGLAIADFSSAGDGVRNPDVAAPGAHIESLRAPGSNADLNHSDAGTLDGAYTDDMLFKGTGTSQATAVTAGVVALLNQQYPGLTPDQYKSLLTTTAQPIAGSDSSAGANLVPRRPRCRCSHHRHHADLDARRSSRLRSTPPASPPAPRPTAGVEHPGVEHPGVEHPGVEHPGVEHPGVEHPGVEHPGVEHPGVEHPGVEHPGVEHPGVEHPGVEHPGVEHPGVEHPGVEHPGVEHPGVEHPGVEHPGAEHPGAEHPGAEHPGAEHPGAEHPGAEHPGVEHPGAEHPGAEHPGVEHPGVEHPGVEHPGVEHPGADPLGVTATSATSLRKSFKFRSSAAESL